MANFFDRLAAGPNAMQSSDYDMWNQTVGSAPPERFQQAANQAIQQVSPEEYYQHTQPGVGGTNPIGRLPQTQRAGIAESLLSALTGSGMNTNQIQQQANLQTLDPRQMSPQELASLLQYVKQNNPNALSQVATRYQTQPDILHSLLSNKALIGLAIGLGAKLLADQANRGAQYPNQSGRPMV